MNKAELIMKVSEKANVTQKVAKVIVDTLFDGMMESLEKGERIEIRGFGSFVVRTLRWVQRAETPRQGRSWMSLPRNSPSSRLGKN